MRVSLLTIIVLSLAPAALGQMSSGQRVVDFQQLAALFSKRYAFVEWKATTIPYDGLNLAPWLDRVKSAKDDLEYFEICSEYVAGYQDGHTVFQVPSDFQADLGITADLYSGKVLIDGIDRTRLAAPDYPFEIGDELIALDGRNMDQWIADMMLRVGDGNRSSSRRNRRGNPAHRRAGGLRASRGFESRCSQRSATPQAGRDPLGYSRGD